MVGVGCGMDWVGWNGCGMGSVLYGLGRMCVVWIGCGMDWVW